MESPADRRPVPPAFLGAVDALDQAGVLFTIRKPPKERELDLFVEAGSRHAAGDALVRSGFAEVAARGQRRHRFYLTYSAGIWQKIDVKLTPGRTWLPAPNRVARVFARVAAQVPPTRRRSGLVIVFLGPDGAGKSTVINAISERTPVACHVWSAGSGGSRGSRAGRPRGPTMRLKVREPLAVLKKLLRSAPALVRIYAAAWRGGIVLCEGHPREALATRLRITPLAVRLERFLLRRVIPTPDLTVVLDAPTAVLLGRKDEHPAADLDRWRSGYHEEFPEGQRVHHVGTDRPLDDTVADIQGRIWAALQARRGSA
ncbi:MAG: hypothetical protein WAU41_03705 [Gaiellaceae bacterium]